MKNECELIGIVVSNQLIGIVDCEQIIAPAQLPSSGNLDGGRADSVYGGIIPLELGGA